MIFNLNKIARPGLISIMMLQVLTVSAQKEVKHTRQGNREYRDSKFEDAELLYRRSVDANPEYSDAFFNLGDALYKQEKYSDAAKSFDSLAEKEIDLQEKSNTLYNLGNSLLKDNKLQESIAEYKNSLRLNPGNMRAKYNLAYAQDLLREQQQQQQQQQDKDKQQEGNQDNKEQTDESNKDQDQDQDKDQQDDQKSDPNQDEKQDEQEKDQQQQMSKEDAERLLQALAADEQDVQDKVKRAKASKSRVRTLKNW